jgi:nifR3 family TIM-barrel protein
MHTFINSSWTIGSLQLPNRLIQGPLAGYSCAPFRILFNQFKAPAYCVSEMSSSIDTLSKHAPESRYLYRAAEEKILAYQIAGNDPQIMAQAAQKLELLGADLIDINCGCPKIKMRKKGSGSALLENPERLIEIIRSVREAIRVPLTVKIRIQGSPKDLMIAQQIEQTGADALIIHGRRWTEDYDIPCDYQQIAHIKRCISIPVIANGDINNANQLQTALEMSACDAFMISRGGSGRPWLYQELLEGQTILPGYAKKIELFMQHLQGLAQLEQEFKAVLQSKSLVRYYFRIELSEALLTEFYKLTSLRKIELFLKQL